MLIQIIINILKSLSMVKRICTFGNKKHTEDPMAFIISTAEQTASFTLCTSAWQKIFILFPKHANAVISTESSWHYLSSKEKKNEQKAKSKYLGPINNREPESAAL